LRCGASIFAKTLEISFAKLWIRLIDLKSDIDRDSLSLVAIQCMPSSGSADFVDCLLEKKSYCSKQVLLDDFPTTREK
jgi:hypothetical protein